MTNYMNANTLTAAERKVYRRFAGLALPRHTSYPIASVWKPEYGPAELCADLQRSARQGQELSVYVHIPFCERLCYFCACTKEIVPPQKRRQHDPVEELLSGLEIEAGRFAAVVGAAAGQVGNLPPPVRQVHLGGGSPTFLTASQLTRLWQIIQSHFTVTPDAEIAVEVDPRSTSREQLETLRNLGFNRVSLGVQGLPPAVQRAVNRVQPFELVEQLVHWCRELRFDSVNFDLIYGLPFQSLDTLTDTLDKTIALSPDRVAFYRLAVIPEIFRWQNVFRATDLPSGDLPLELNLLAINRFLDAGYEFIGLDHFAKPDEAWRGLTEMGHCAGLSRA